MKLILVVCGQSNKELGIAENSDSLTAVGIIESRQAGIKLKDTKIDLAYCSPSGRADEMLSGILSEKPEENIGISMSRLLGPKLKNEDFSKLKRRVEVFVDELQYDHKPENTILIVTHKKVAEMIYFFVKRDHRELTGTDITFIDF